MNLSEWKKTKQKTDIEIADIIGVHRSYICHIRTGRRIPSPNVALAIEKATSGKVTKEELLWPEK